MRAAGVAVMVVVVAAAVWAFSRSPTPAGPPVAPPATEHEELDAETTELNTEIAVVVREIADRGADAPQPADRQKALMSAETALGRMGRAVAKSLKGWLSVHGLKASNPQLTQNAWIEINQLIGQARESMEECWESKAAERKAKLAIIRHFKDAPSLQWCIDRGLEWGVTTDAHGKRRYRYVARHADTADFYTVRKMQQAIRGDALLHIVRVIKESGGRL